MEKITIKTIMPFYKIHPAWWKEVMKPTKKKPKLKNMSVKELTRDQVKRWVVNNASLTNPNKGWWYASVTIGGYDYNERGELAEQAYDNLTNYILKFRFITDSLQVIIDKQSA